MCGKLTFVFLALFAAQGLCVTEIWLEDRNVSYIQSNIFYVGFSIAQWYYDTLLECHVIVPDGTRYEAYPNNKLPSHIIFSESFFDSCSVAMIGIGVEYSGTYQLLSLIRHRADNRQTLTRQRNHLTVTLPRP